MEPFVPKSYSQEELFEMARHGSVQDKITVVSRSYVSQEILEWLMENDASDEVKTEIISRSDVTPERLAWAANTENCNILGRVASNDKTPLPTVKAILERAEGREGEVWELLAQFASRVITRRETGVSPFDIRKGTLPESPQ